MSYNVVRIIAVFDKHNNRVSEIPISLKENQLSLLREYLILDKEDPLYGMFPIGEELAGVLKRNIEINVEFDFVDFEYFLDCYVN